MSSVPLALATAVFAVAVVACTPAIVAPGQWLEVREQPVDAMGAHERCVTLKPGDRLEWRFTAKLPVSFNIHYHEGKVVIAPITREKVTEDSGMFDPLTAQEYCLMWEAGPTDTLIGYSMRVQPR